MKYHRSVVFVLVCLLGPLGMGACSTSRPARQRLSDVGITSKVKGRLIADPDVNPFKIDVDTVAGVVFLKGTVARELQRQEAEELARRTRGVRDVVNDLGVGRESFTDAMNDAWIVAKVKTRLARGQINPLNIDVDSDHGVITLSGQVASDWQRHKAGELASWTKGVTSVDNRLLIAGQ